MIHCAITNGVVNCCNPLRKVELSSTSCNASRNKEIARQPMLHCVILQQLVSQCHCETSRLLRKLQCNRALNIGVNFEGNCCGAGLNFWNFLLLCFLCSWAGWAIDKNRDQHCIEKRFDIKFTDITLLNNGPFLRFCQLWSLS